MRGRSLPIVVAAIWAGCAGTDARPRDPIGKIPSVVTTAQPEWIPFRPRAGREVAADPRETHLGDLRQLTFGGENAEAYWSPDGRKLVFQSTPPGAGCDQIYEMDLESGAVRRVSSGAGKTTCSYFLYPDGQRVLFSSTQAEGAACPPKPDRTQGYVWPLDAYDIYTAKLDGSDLRPLVVGPWYDAEATVAVDGSRMVFTSTRDGDLELYTAKLDGSDIRRVTNEPGYDGGAFFSPDGTKLVWRASRPVGEALDEYKALLKKGLVRPTQLEIMVAGSAGQHARKVTRSGAASFAPSFFPDSRRIVFSSNLDADPRAQGMPSFELYAVDPEAPPTVAGTPPLDRITYHEGFDGFPVFSPDGEYLVFASNRHGSRPGETNIFVARWID